MSLLASLLLPLSIFGAKESVSLATAAEASSRPRVCRSTPGAARNELWRRAGRAPARDFCVLLAQGYSKLDRAPGEALALAHKASAILPNEVEPSVLRGRALLRLGDASGARAALASSVTAPGRPLGDLGALRELGLAFSETKQLADAAAVYRMLVPRIDFVQDRLVFRIILLEAASVVMASSELGAAEATSYLAQARQAEPVPGLQDLTVALAAVALDRDGKGDQAGALDARLNAWSLERFLSTPDRLRIAKTLSLDDSVTRREPSFRDRGPILADGELHAAIGLAAARRDPLLAATHFKAFLETRGAQGPFANWARRRLAMLEAAGGGS